ncbi:hypothetical protein ACFX10_007454 [Malus domestica]
MHPNPPSPSRVNRTFPSLSHVPPHHRLSYEIPSCSKSKKKSKSGKGNKFPLGFVTPNACSTRHSQPPIRTRLGFSAFRIGADPRSFGEKLPSTSSLNSRRGSRSSGSASFLQRWSRYWLGRWSTLSSTG